MQLLRECGFDHNPSLTTDRQRPGRWVFEVYTHTAQVVLFGLPQIIKYKKGRVAQRRAGLQTLRNYIRTCFTVGTPPLKEDNNLGTFLERDLDDLKGHSLKAYEDALDGLVCAYLSAFYWFWGAERNEIIGDLKTGYIINPTSSLCQAIYPERG